MLIHPDRRAVFPLAHEAIIQQDGHTKNDCELNAAKRLQQHMKDHYQDLPFLFVEDALYANGPHLEQILSNEWDYLINVKPGSHQSLFTLFEAHKAKKQVKFHQVKDASGLHSFYWMNQVRLNNSTDLRVNFLYYEQLDAIGKLKKFSWISSVRINKRNVMTIMQAARAIWKIENETFNTLKNQGYHFEHNYGHGYQYLCENLASLMFLAFWADQLIQACNHLFNLIWHTLKAKYRVWERIRALFMIYAINSFEHLFSILAQVLQIPLDSS